MIAVQKLGKQGYFTKTQKSAQEAPQNILQEYENKASISEILK